MEIKLDRPLAFLDIESTGLNVTTDRIVEIAILKIQPNGAVNTKNYRVNPGIPIPKETSLIHGIYDKDVANEPGFGEIAPTLAMFLTDCDLGGYNSNYFDVPLLMEEFQRVGISFDVDDRRLIDVQKIFHLMEKRTLEAAYQFYCNKELVNTHTASADAHATYEILIGQLEKYPELDNNVAFLDKFTRTEQFVDLGRRMVYKNDEVYFNFGKHKGKKVVDVLEAEPQYYDWIMNNDFLHDTKQKLKEIRDKQRAKKV